MPNLPTPLAPVSFCCPPTESTKGNHFFEPIAVRPDGMLDIGRKPYRQRVSQWSKIESELKRGK